MAQDSANSVVYYLQITLNHKNYLASIRHWNNLKVGIENEYIWLKDLSEEQLDSIQVKSIPYKKLYYSQAGKLFLQGSLLPDRNIPGLLWTPIDRAFPIELPSYNHNFFSLPNKIDINIVSVEAERDSAAILIGLEMLEQYIETAPAIRFKNQRWVLLGDKALIIGSPILPIPGQAFWRKNDFLIPVGYDFELPILSDNLEKLLNSDNLSVILWQKEGHFINVCKESFRPLSIGSFRLSFTM